MDIVMKQRKAYMSEDMEDVFEVNLNLLRTVEGDAPHLANGEVAKRTYHKLWLNPNSVAYNRKTGEPGITRQFFTALMGVPVESAIPNVKTVDCLGRKLKITLSVVTKDGNSNNKVTSFLPVK